MGGQTRVEAQHARGRLTVRERIDGLLDPGTFLELGTFAHSIRSEDADSTPGDGKIGGWGRIDGAPVVVAGDDVTVKRASSSVVGGRKLRRLFESAHRDGIPFVFFGETGGARIPDIMGSAGFSEVGPLAYPTLRRRAMAMITVIAGESFGGSSFIAAVSDVVIQVRGTCLAVSSPRVIEAATGESITMEQLGGTDVHARFTGQIDLVADDEPSSWRLVRRVLSYFPSVASAPPPRVTPTDPEIRAPEIDMIVPENRRQVYDMHELIRGIVDAGSMLELRQQFASSLITALARLDGRPIGVLANNPLVQAGVLTPDACDKAVRLISLCDAYGLPLVFLHDTPGFLIGRDVEHDRLLSRAMVMQQAVAMAGVPRLSVVIRKSFGLANHAMSGIGLGSDLLVAWPGAEISFMDPMAAASVLSPAVDGVEDERASIAHQVAFDPGPFGAAGGMHVDEIIEPSATRRVLIEALDRAAQRAFIPGSQRPLAFWPTSL
jgi:acetyl-CoA carboxylase carboxyltransferase component